MTPAEFSKRENSERNQRREDAVDQILGWAYEAFERADEPAQKAEVAKQLHRIQTLLKAEGVLPLPPKPPSRQRSRQAAA